ncbi:NAD(P)H-hydrate dehydratase [Sphingomonas sp. LB-2]|uniref:NAD(P)H-hydrate dehydratase n=1 Tax=Sphingomonas caeni TaxID=2984949 RepID=UPI002232CB1A|nr:NAD(P)H-hydrate dehydratase [Sphingomonas caeni]MCW3848761.1 NAD(P)H-hydrate dehydratase [Sphingomonas caeni]
MIPANAPIVTADAMRAAEERAFRHESQHDVMERAGEAVAREAARFALGRPILVLAGPGNNGGDAYVAARLLKASGHDVSVAALGEPKTGAAEAMFRAWEGPTTSLYEARARPFVIDGLFGTGLARPIERGPRALMADLIKAAEFSLAIDLPSGLDTDSGEDLGAQRVTATIALAALKPAHVLAAGLEKCGHVLLADIGIRVDTSWRTVARPRLRAPGAHDHKYSRGMVAIVEGAMPGAARLAAGAAMAGGAGYVTLAGSGEGGPDALVRRAIDGADALVDFLADERIDALVIGPGLGRERRAENMLKAALASAHPLVLDGDALSLLGRGAGRWLNGRAAPAWLTPHAGEFDRMFEIEGSKIERTLAAAAETGATVIHKGGDTVIASPQGDVRVLAGATPWLSTAGTGDILAGLLAARVAGGQRGTEAAEAAVWLHAGAAHRAGPAFIADTLIDHIPGALAQCL